MNLFCLGSAVVSAIFKGLAAEGVSCFDFAVLRAAAGLICISMVNLYQRSNPLKEIPRRHYLKMGMRSFLGTWNFIVFNWVVTLIPLTLQMVVFQTQPFWVSIIAVIFLKESIMRFEYAGMLISFAGVILIAFCKGAGGDSDNETSKMLVGIAVTFCMAWAQSFIGLFNRMMVDVNWYVVMFWHSTLGLLQPFIVISIEAMFKGEFRLFSAYTSRQWGILIAASFIDFLMLSSQIIATQACSLSFVSLFGYLVVFYAFLLDIFIFHVNFTLLQGLGALTILGATVTVGIIKFCKT